MSEHLVFCASMLLTVDYLKRFSQLLVKGIPIEFVPKGKK